MTESVLEKPSLDNVTVTVEKRPSNPNSKSQQRTARSFARQISPSQPAVPQYKTRRYDRLKSNVRTRSNDSDLSAASSQRVDSSQESDPYSLARNVAKDYKLEASSLPVHSEHQHDIDMIDLKDSLVADQSEVNLKAFKIFAIAILLGVPALIWGLFTFLSL